MNATRVFGWTAALLLACLFGALGAWQYGRGEWKAAWLADWDAALSAAPVALPALDPAVPVTRPLRVAARLADADAAGWLLLDNQRRGDAVGVRAYRLLDVGTALLVADFGWMPFDRGRELPAPPLPEGELDVHGLLLPWPGQGLALAPGEWPSPPPAALLLTRLDREEIAAATGRPVIDGVLKIDPDAPFGFARDLDALPNTLPAEKHYGYALQWWGFAVTVLLIAVVLERRNKRP